MGGESLGTGKIMSALELTLGGFLGRLEKTARSNPKTEENRRKPRKTERFFEFCHLETERLHRAESARRASMRITTENIMTSNILDLDEARAAAVRRLDEADDVAACDREAITIFAIEDQILRAPAVDMQELVIKARLALAAFDHKPGDAIDETLNHAERAAVAVLLDLVRLAGN
jgi:hypothetical protein